MTLLLSIPLLAAAFALGTYSVWGLERLTEKGWKDSRWYESLESLELPLLILWLVAVNGGAVTLTAVMVSGLGPAYFDMDGWLYGGGLMIAMCLGEIYLGVKFDRLPPSSAGEES